MRAFWKSAGAVFLCFFALPLVHAAPRVQLWTHPSGAQVAWVQASAIPMVDVRVEFDAGARRDPPGLAGLASAMALVASRGVAESHGQPALGENELAERWLDLGAQWSLSASNDRLSAQLRSLSDPAVLEPALDLAARLLARPAWESEDEGVRQRLAQAWERDRQRLVAAWRAQQVQPGTVAAQRFTQAVMGTHPYGAVASPESWARMDVEALRAHWRRHVAACRARVSVVGDVDEGRVRALVQRLLQPLEAAAQGRGCEPLPPVPPVQPLAQAQRIDVPMATAQAHVLMGQPGYSRRDPDFFALLVGNHILGGGGFVSRLTTEVREKRGLSYSVYSYFAPGEHEGPFTLGLQTRPDQAEQALEVAREVVQRFVQEGPSEEELQAALRFMVNGFALRIDSNAKLLDNVANILWFGLPADYLQTWTQAVSRVTVQDVRRAFARVLAPQRMVTVVVGGGTAAGS